MPKRKDADKKIYSIARKLVRIYVTRPKVQAYLRRHFPKNRAENKLILEKVKSIIREKEIKEEVYSDSAHHFSSRSHQKHLKIKFIQEDKENLKFNNKFSVKRKELYQYFRKVGHSGGISLDFFDDAFDKEAQMKLVNNATEDFKTYYDYFKRFRSKVAEDRLEMDQLPQEGLSEIDKPFFEDARTDFINSSKGGVGTLFSKKPFKERKIQEMEDPLVIAGKMQGDKKKLSEKLLQNNWYRQDLLNENQTEVLKELGYQFTDKNHPVYDFNGKLVACAAFKQGGFKHKSYTNDRRESLHHFSRAYLLKQLIPSAEILVRMKNEEGEDRIIDAVITSKENERKIAIEFQESHKIDAERIRNKILPILAHYDLLIIVCSEQFKGVYEQVKHENFGVANNAEFQAILKGWGAIK